MLLATSQVEDFDQFVSVFSTKGAEKRKQHGCSGSHVFRDQADPNRVWIVFDWDEAGWQAFLADPETPAIMQTAGLKGKPQLAAFIDRFDS